MPIQIKRPEFKKYDKRYRISCVISAIISVLFLAALFGLMGIITDSGSKIASAVLFAAYILFFAADFYSIVCGVAAYKNEDNVSDLFQCLFFAASEIFCLMNLRFALIMIFSAFGLSSATDTLKGSDLTYSEFVSTQYANWVCILIGCILTIVMGIFAAVKLAKNKNK